MDIGDLCDYCEDRDCMRCSFSNPCLGCDDYDPDTETCKSKGACGGEMEVEHEDSDKHFSSSVVDLRDLGDEKVKKMEVKNEG